MVSNASFDNILIISWRSVLLWKKLEYPENVVLNTYRNERYSKSQR